MTSLHVKGRCQFLINFLHISEIQNHISKNLIAANVYLNPCLIYFHFSYIVYDVYMLRHQFYDQYNTYSFEYKTYVIPNTHMQTSSNKMFLFHVRGYHVL